MARQVSRLACDPDKKIISQYRVLAMNFHSKYVLTERGMIGSCLATPKAAVDLSSLLKILFNIPGLDPKFLL